MSNFQDGNGKQGTIKPAATANAGAGAEKPISVDGFQQVLDMLRIADPAFRESLLRRLAARDRDLAQDLRRDLGI